MAAKLKAGKKPAKTSRAKPLSKKDRKEGADRAVKNLSKGLTKILKDHSAKKSKPEKTTRAAAPTRSQSGGAKGAKAPAVSSPKNDWRIVNIVVDHAQVYGLSSDGRIYRWNTRSALWVLHKDGLTA
jgi:hypothetical protein